MEDELIDYDEFAMLKDNANRRGIEWSGQPDVTRRFFNVGDGQRVSALAWGTEEPEVVLLHGGGQNAHTWDSVVMALGLSALAIDLPGHGHSDWRSDHDYGPWQNADAVAAVIGQEAPNARAVVGMSLGGSTNMSLAARYPHLVRRAVFVDISPSSNARRGKLTTEQRGATALLDGPKTFDSFDDMVRAAAEAVPGRSVESLRIGVLHNARSLADGRWGWRYDPDRNRNAVSPTERSARLWEDVSAIRAPIMLVRGGESVMVQSEDLDELLRRQPTAIVEVVEGSHHSVQSDRPLELAALIKQFLTVAVPEP